MIERVEHSVDSVKELLSRLTNDQQWGVMLEFEKVYPDKFALKIVGVDDFFQVATTAEDWHGEEEKETVNKFQSLVQTLKENLSNLQVYRLGNKEIDAYVVGETPTGDLAGISTKVVET